MPGIQTRRRFIKNAALTSAGLCAAPAYSVDAASTDWRHYGGSAGSTRYSALDQINRENVNKLRVAWTHNTGDAMQRPATKIECTPIVVDGRMYLTTAQLQVRALGAATGEVLWNFDPFEGVRMRRSKGVNRGVTYWSDGDDRRVFMSAAERLYCLNADTGKLIKEFAKDGILDMKTGLDREMPSSVRYFNASPPSIFEDILLLGGGAGSEGPAPAAPGHIRGYDVRTGKRLWIFHTIPQPGELGYDTWGKDNWKTVGGTNNWAGMSVDEERGLLFASTGSPTFDFYGGDRPGANLFGNCVLALDARTGERKWHYQTTHHDLWDYDLPAQPVLARVRRNGEWRDLVVQISKQGFWFVFDRETGRPVWDVEELETPGSDIAGEQAYATQPFPTKPAPFARQGFNEQDVTDISPKSREHVMRQLKDLRAGQLYTPPSRQGTIFSPGTMGGTVWGGCSHDPETGLVYINTNNWPKQMAILDAPEGADYPYRGAGYPFFLDQDKYSAAKPPWGELLCLDLASGEYRWRKPLGDTYPALKAKGIDGTGTFNIGGSIVTKGGLLFIGATQDEKFRAIDSSSGDLLWQHQLSAGGYATPSSYAVEGRQYVVIAAGGGGRSIGQGGTQSGDEYVAFALD